MPFQLLNTAVYTALELAINNTLELDSVSQKKISLLSGSVLEINCTTPSLQIFLSISGHAIHLSSHYEGEPDTCITGSSRSLLKLVFSKDKNQNFYQPDIEIKGNIELARKLQEIVYELDIDWEYLLSHFIGDIPTEAISTGLNSARQTFKQAHESLLMDIDEYIHEEKKLFPTEKELKSFYNSVDEVRLKVDRVEARLENIQTDIKQS